MIRFKKGKEDKKKNPEEIKEFIESAKAESLKKKIYNFNLCSESIKALEDLAYHYGDGNLSFAVEKILKRFCTVEDEQEEFGKWLNEFKLPEGHRVNRTYYLEVGLHDCLNEVKRKFRIREKAKMLRLLIFFYYAKEGLIKR